MPRSVASIGYALVVAMLFRVRYPDGEITWGTGYPDLPLIVREVPRGPACCYLDEIEVQFGAPEPLPVLRVVGGPRRPTHHVRVAGTLGERDLWMDAREADGWVTCEADDPAVVWVVAGRDGLDVAELVRHGGVLVEPTG